MRTFRSNPNRYAWTNIGPITIDGAGRYNTQHVRSELAKIGITVERWARNWTAFEGWAVRTAYMSNPFAYAGEHGIRMAL